MRSGSGRWWQAAVSRLDRWRPARGLVVVGDGAGWSFDHDADVLARMVRASGQQVCVRSYPAAGRTAFFVSRVTALAELDRWRRMGVAVCMPYYHGYPGQGDEGFDRTYEHLRRGHEHVARVQVTHARMHALVLKTGIDPGKVHTIRLGVDTQAFVPRTPELRAAARRQLLIPESAVVIGSFQKDGVGWGDGLEPKLIKGPDVLVNVLVSLRRLVPELFVLLSGPSRGFVRKGLAAAGIPYVHTFPAAYTAMPPLLQAIDACVVTSRQEGGPKAVLESMASGVPIVTTRVGQAAELIRHGENGWLADVDDVDALTRFTYDALNDTDAQRRYTGVARRTAEENDYQAQAPQWLDFFSGLLP